MATLTTQTLNRAGFGPTYAAATAGGDAMACGSGMFLHIKNSGGAARQVTFNVPAVRQAEPNVAITSPVITVPGPGEKMVGPVDAATFSDPTTALCSLTYPGTEAGLTVAAIQLTQP